MMEFCFWIYQQSSEEEWITNISSCILSIYLEGLVIMSKRFADEDLVNAN